MIYHFTYDVLIDYLLPKNWAECHILCFSILVMIPNADFLCIYLSSNDETRDVILSVYII